jgi:acetyltransferase-like isoleucine patch superfamily enzyme
MDQRRSPAIAEPAEISKKAAAVRHPGVKLHETAVVDEPAEIGEGTRIWHFSHVLGGVRIGRDCVIGQNAMIGPDVTIGNRCKIQNNVSLYKGVTLEDGVFCGPSCVFTNVLYVRAEIERKDEFRPTLVKRGASIGANATVVCGTTLGEYCFIAAGAVVTHDVAPHALVAGVPARQIGWVSHAGERLGPDLVCPREGRRYRVTDENQLEEIP